MAISKEKDKTLEDFLEEVFMAIWAVIHFSIMPVKSRSTVGSYLENFVRSLIFYSLLVGCLWLYSFAHKKEELLSQEHLIQLFALSALLFVIRHFLSKGQRTKHSRTKKITVQDLKPQKIKFQKLFPLMEKRNKTPIGISLVSREPVWLDLSSRVQHTIVSGATGQGKTTLLKTLLEHSLKHGHPVIIIDPKGERTDIQEMRAKAAFYGREKDFSLFSLSFPEQSHAYNPLENGTSEQIKARLIDGLRFEHEYFKAQASLWMGAILYAFEVLGKTVTFSGLRELLSSKEKLRVLQRDIDKLKNHPHKERLQSGLSSAFQIKTSDLAGVFAQISSIDSAVFTNIISPKEDEEREKLVLSDVLQHKKIAYFQMNVNGYGDISRRIGRIILQDLKVLSNQIQAGQRDFHYDFCACFVDEFGSFATQDFADFLKMARSSRIGIHLFCQGLADLKAITSEFKEQIIGNTSSKIIFRQDVPEDAELWSSMAGTFSSTKRTFQVTGSETDEELTGVGSIRDVKEMRIEFDVFKKLSPGQAVLIDKARHKEDLLKVWRAKGRRTKHRKQVRISWVERRIEELRGWFAQWKEAPLPSLKEPSKPFINTSEEEEASRLEWERHMESLKGLRGKSCEREGLPL
ncbi:MAG: DUF853 family protein [Bdellovibrionales bacterium]|nr:DUF853 family protein [Bdellovibrionales bacterium]